MGFSKSARSFIHSDTNFSFADAPISWKGKRNKAVSLSAATPTSSGFIVFSIKNNIFSTTSEFFLIL